MLTPGIKTCAFPLSPRIAIPLWNSLKFYYWDSGSSTHRPSEYRTLSVIQKNLVFGCPLTDLYYNLIWCLHSGSPKLVIVNHLNTRHLVFRYSDPDLIWCLQGRQSDWDARLKSGFNPYHGCSQHKDCRDVDMNMVRITRGRFHNHLLLCAHHYALFYSVPFSAYMLQPFTPYMLSLRSLLF